jgi:hypothetical protein
VRSHKHTVRTSNNPGHVISCEYDDGAGPGENDGKSPNSVEAEPESAGKKKRKAAGEPKRKKKDDEDMQTAALMKKIGM